MGRARTLWLSSMLGTAMVVQAFGFAGSAGASNSMVQVGTVGVTYQVPIGVSNTLKNVAGGFWIGTTEVTYDEWYDVRTWAEKNGYTFANKGREGHDGVIGAAPTSARNEPVTNVSWHDVIVWSNAKSQKEGWTPVYVLNGHVLKNAHAHAHAVVQPRANGYRLPTNVKDAHPVVQQSANGYRLPTNDEWEMAARWLGTTAPNSGSLAWERIATTVRDVTHYWTPGSYASGAVEKTSNTTETNRVAWSSANAGGASRAVGTTERGNALGMYDVSGNVWEWTFEIQSETNRTCRGGSWSDGRAGLPVSLVSPFSTDTTLGSVGFRLSRTGN